MKPLNLVLMVALTAGVIVTAGMLSLGPREDEDPERRRVARLLRKLGDPDLQLRREAEEAFRKMGAGAVPVLREAAVSEDRMLSRRAAVLLRELRPPAPGMADAPEPPEKPEAPPAEAVEAPVRFVLTCPVPEVPDLAEARFYVRLVNEGPSPVILARDARIRYGRFARFEIRRGGRSELVSCEPAPSPGEEESELIVVPGGATFDLYAGQLDGRTGPGRGMAEPGEVRVRFVYDASEESAYRAAVEGAPQGVPLPAGRMASNEAVIRIAP